MSTIALVRPRSSRSLAAATTKNSFSLRAHSRTIIRVALVFLLAIFVGQFVAMAQNLGAAPVFGRAVQGQQATTVEGTVLNVVNWSCNVIAPLIGVGCLGMAAWHYKSGRGYGGWIASGVGLFVISGAARLAEGLITQAGAV